MFWQELVCWFGISGLEIFDSYKMLEITDLKRLGALSDAYYLQGVTVGIWAAIINTVLLLVAVFFSVYKPWKNIKK